MFLVKNPSKSSVAVPNLPAFAPGEERKVESKSEAELLSRCPQLVVTPLKESKKSETKAEEAKPSPAVKKTN
jgi:hypothetical protein